MNRIQASSALMLLTATICVLAGLPVAQAQVAAADGTVELLTTPPELTSKVAPNVVLTFDDSGSMSWHHMPDYQPYRSTDTSWASGIPAGSAITETASSSFASGALPYLCAGAIDPTVSPDQANPRTWAMNGVYYNPQTSYKPPVGADGKSFDNASYTKAWVNGIAANRPTNKVTNATTYDLSNTTTSGGKRFCGNMPGYYKLKTGVALALGTDGKLDSASVTRLYTAANWEWVNITATAEKQNFANWFSYYRTRAMAAITATSLAYADFDSSIRIAWQNINANTTANPWVAGGTTVLAPFEGAARVNFYNWLFNNPASGGTPNQAAAKRVGDLFTYGKDIKAAKNPYWDSSINRELSCRKNFHIQMTDGMWNGSTEAVTQTDTKAIASMPDGRGSYSTDAAQSKIFWNEGSKGQNTMADIAFHYWATDLRTDFKGNAQTRLKVRPYLKDRTTGITGGTGLAAGDSWLDNDELYWNPANDPATWPHLVQYMIGFGVNGTIPATADNYSKLRMGTLAWPKLDGSGGYTDNAKKIDDMWHAAINSRGEFFAAGNPDQLIDAIRKIIASVTAQSTASTPASVSLPILTGGNSAYQGGYDSSSWSGSFRRSRLDATGEPAEVIWDAGCLLSGGLCQEPAGSGTARDPGNRMIVTSNGVTSGRPFRWSSLDLDQQIALSQKPGAAACTALGAVGCDAFGSDRIDYLRGKRTNEAASATPSFRSRASVLGAVVNGEAAYVSSPRSGYHDMFPDGSPEAEAVKADEANSYAAYQNAQRSRKPMAYVGANDGMLHAFDAETGKEEWAYVPNTLIRNGRLAKSTGRDSGLTPGVDARPREADVFIKNKWRTVLLGSLRLGGRGIFALDVTQPTMASESDAAGGNGVLLWEFSNGGAASEVAAAPCSVGAHTCASLGYTYDSANIARIRFGDKWVAVVSSGYFPSNADAAAASHDRTDPAASRTSLLVIDLETGTLIREIRTSAAPQQRPSGFKTFGLSTPMVYDLASDEVDDIVYAGDLAGNLWRFDLTDAEDPNNWTVDLMFTTYGNGGADKAGNQPIVFNPTALRDPVTRRPILVFGTGKYLGGDDRTSAIPQQAYYGVRDYGADSDFYPIAVDNLVTQKMTQADDSTRSITGYEDPAVTPSGSVPPMYLGADAGEEQPAVVAHGWRIRLDVATEKGERAQRRAIPLATANVALLYGLIPKSDDPCDPGARYSIMAIDAATGSALSEEGGIAASGLVGAVLAAPTPPSDPVIKRGGDGGVIVGLPPGIPPAVKDALDDVLRRAIPPWHRGAWRELLGW